MTEYSSIMYLITFWMMLLFPVCHLVCRCFVLLSVHVRVQVYVLTQLCLTLCDSMDRKPPGSSVHGILQARIPEWVASPFSRGLPNPGIKAGSPALAGRFFTTELPRKSNNPIYGRENSKRSLKDLLHCLIRYCCGRTLQVKLRLYPSACLTCIKFIIMSVIMLMLL